MQPGEEIESVVTELEQIVSEAKSPLTGGANRKIIDAQDVYEILDEIRRVFPQEFADARRIVKEEAETLERAQMQADSIIADAQQQAMILAGDQDIATDDPTLPSEPAAMRQGPHRFARAHNYFEAGRKEAERRGVPFNWTLQVVPGIGHDGRAMSAVCASL